MGWCPSGADGKSADQKIPRILWNQKLQYHVHNNTQLDSVLSQSCVRFRRVVAGQPTSCRITPCQLFVAAYSIYGGCLLHSQADDAPCHGERIS